MRTLRLSKIEKIAVVLITVWIAISVYVGLHLPEINSLGY